jgi:hypothetical protein
MAEIINLRRVRKAKAREDAAKAAEEARAKHGRPKADRTLDEARAELAARRLEQGRIERDGEA